jgi:DNA-binding winged helix-turn-helix (wHTH) protein
MESNDSHSLVCFGPYEVDLRTQEIRKHRTLIRLTGQPCQILEMLLARPGDLITRDELQQRLWPGESLVDCTHGLNAAINKLREALGDSAITPQYVETLPRRGYRFIGKLRASASEPAVLVVPASEIPASASPVQDATLTSTPRSTSPPEHFMARYWAIALVSVGALVIGGLGGMEVSLRFRPQLNGVTRPNPATYSDFAEGRQKRQMAPHAAKPEAPRQSPVRGAIAQPAVLREPTFNSPHHDPTFRTVVSGSGSAGPQFSPDGKHIAFMSNRGGPWQIWVSSVDGSDPVQISSTDSAGTPRWSPNGKQIVFDAPCDDGTCIYIAPLDRREPGRRLDEGFVPSFSRNGRWVFFASERSEGWQVWKIPTRRGLAQKVTRQGGFAAFESSDGFVYYAKSRDGSPEIWRVRPAGGEESLVSGRIRPRTWASWTATQQGILFVSDAPGKGSQLSLYETASGQIRQLLSLPSSPFWMGASADGHRVAVNDAAERQITLVENLR